VAVYARVTLGSSVGINVHSRYYPKSLRGGLLIQNHSVIRTILIMSPSCVLSHAHGTVQRVIHARNCAQMCVATASSSLPMWNCRAVIPNQRYLGRIATLRAVNPQTYILLSHLMDRLDEVQCNVIVPKQLATCEHLARMPCSASPINFKCSAKCDRTRPCCGKPCLAACHKCQTLSLANTSDEFIGSVARDAHAPHPCEKTL
jgi:hypothetical protein